MTLHGINCGCWQCWQGSTEREAERSARADATNTGIAGPDAGAVLPDVLGLGVGGGETLMCSPLMYPEPGRSPRGTR